VEDPALVEVLKARNIGLTCCPISNSIVTTTAKFPEILQLLRQGVKVTCNSDDPAYFRGYLHENLVKLAKETDITRKELILLQRNVFEISWVSGWKRDELLQRLEEYEHRTLGKAAS
jgi:adenine deaminase